MAPRRGQRTAALYVAVLVVAMIVAMIGLSALTTSQIGFRSAERTDDFAHAALYAQSAIELGLFWMDDDPDWRVNRPSGTWVADQPLGGGSFTLQVVDPNDGDLADASDEAVLLTGIGVEDEARHMIAVTLTPTPRPLEALYTALHAGGLVTVLSGKSAWFAGAPLSSNGEVSNAGTIFGDVEAATVSNTGTISGTVTTAAPAKSLPDAGVVGDYAAKAMSIAFPGAIDKQVLSPAANPWGATDPDGLYLIDTGTNDLIIKGSRIQGTLVVKCGAGKKVILDDAVLLQNQRADYPALIVDGDLELLLNSGTSRLSESTWSTNFNPTGTPYGGASDADQSDSYPNEVRGLVHVTGNLLISLSSRVRGVVICEGNVSCEGAGEVLYDPAVAQSPPQGYGEKALRIAPGGWQRTQAP